MGAFTMGMQREGMNTRLVCVRASTITCPSLPPSLLPSLPPLPSGHNAVLHACTVEDEAFVGIGATLLDGVVVESGAMVAAGSLVLANTRVPSGQVRGALLVLLGALLLGQSTSSTRCSTTRAVCWFSRSRSSPFHPAASRLPHVMPSLRS